MSLIDKKSKTTGKYPVAKVNGKAIYIDTNDDIDPDEAKVSIVAKSVEALPFIPNDQQRYAAFLSGISGSGKSYELARLIKELKKSTKYKDNLIILFTLNHDQDPAFEGIDMYRIDIMDEDLYTQPNTYFKDSICVFDDYISDSQIELTKALRGLLRFLLETTRKLNVAILASTHIIMDNLNTKFLLNETSHNIFYPRGNMRAILNYAKSYLGISKKAELQAFREKIKRSRVITIHRNYPSYLLTKNRVEIMD